LDLLHGKLDLVKQLVAQNEKLLGDLTAEQSSRLTSASQQLMAYSAATADRMDREKAAIG
jgi:hypothetical protein